MRKRDQAKLDYSNHDDPEVRERWAKHLFQSRARLSARLETAERKATKKINTDRRLRAIESKLDAKLGANAKDESTARLSLAEVAKELDVDPRTVRRYIAQGKLRCFRLGKGDRAPLRITRRDLDAFITAMETEKEQSLKFAKMVQAQS